MFKEMILFTLLNAIKESAAKTRQWLNTYIQDESEKILRKFDEKTKQISALEQKREKLERQQLNIERSIRKNIIIVELDINNSYFWKQLKIQDRPL